MTDPISPEEFEFKLNALGSKEFKKCWHTKDQKINAAIIFLNTLLKIKEILHPDVIETINDAIKILEKGIKDDR